MSFEGVMQSFISDMQAESLAPSLVNYVRFLSQHDAYASLFKMGNQQQMNLKFHLDGVNIFCRSLQVLMKIVNEKFVLGFSC